MLKKIISGYYSKVLFICIVCLCAVTAILLFFGSSLLRSQELDEYLQNYDIAINNLSSVLQSKENTFSNSLSPMFDDKSRNRALVQLCTQGLDSLTQQSQTQVTSLLETICRYDSYLGGVLILGNSGDLYQYDARYKTLEDIGLEKKDFTTPAFTVTLLSDSTLDSLSSGYEKPVSHVYGLAGTIFAYSSSDLTEVGRIILLYSTAELNNLTVSANLLPESTLSIRNQQGEILYSSDADYSSRDKIPLTFYDGSSTTGIVRYPRNTQTMDQETYYCASLYNGLYEYYVSYQVPKSALPASYNQTVLWILATGICLMGILVYAVSLRISDRRIKAIQEGMSKVGQNNLDYRLPVPKTNDEFTKIIQSFNYMCGELQKSVEKTYGLEISQHKAELYAMQTSINPHFLYNTLEQIRVQILKGNTADAAQMLILLSKMYRNQTRRNLYVSIGEECSFCENLINLYMYNYRNFDYEIDLDSSLKLYGLPKHTLQPLVENYFVHGLDLNRDDNFLSIRVLPLRREDGLYARFEVEDNGVSATPGELEQLREKLSGPVLQDSGDNNGFALSNVNRRLKLVFGNSAGIHASCGADGQGFLVTFTIPAVLPENLT